MPLVVVNVAWAIVFAVAGGVVGVVLVLAGSLALPRLIDRLTPNLDEEKEVARGNLFIPAFPCIMQSRCFPGGPTCECAMEKRRRDYFFWPLPF